MSGNQVATGLVLNNTDNDLLLTNIGLSWGSWSQQPMQRIPKRTMQIAFVAQGRTGSPSGTEGFVQYSPQGLQAVNIKLCFDDPWSGSNSTSGTSSNDPRFNVIGQVPSSGSAVTFTYTIGAA